MNCMKKFGRAATLACALATAVAGYADEAQIRRVIGAKLPGVAIESVRPAPVAGLFEIVLRGDSGLQIFYTDAAATMILAGSIFEVRSDRNLTEERLRALSAVKWDSLPFDWAFTIKHGSGRRKIAIFSDPNCPFCRQFEGDLAKLGDVTIHLFLYPVIKPESVRQTKSVWCSRDRARAWMDLMFRNIQPTAAPDCDTPIDKILAYGRKLGASATPTWILSNGEIRSGAVPIAEIRQLLDATK